MFVRSVSIFVGQAEAEKDGIEAKKLLELHNNRYRSPFSLVERFLLKSFFKSGDSGLHSGAFDRRKRGFTAVKILHSDVHGLRSDLFDMLFKELCNFFRVLIRHQAHGNFGGRPGGENRFRPFPDEASPYAVTFQCRASPYAFETCKSLFSVE